MENSMWNLGWSFMSGEEETHIYLLSGPEAVSVENFVSFSRRMKLSRTSAVKRFIEKWPFNERAGKKLGKKLSKMLRT